MTVRIRRLSADDLEPLNRLLPKWHPDIYAKRLAAQDRGELVQFAAWDGEAPVGSGMVLFPTHEEWSASALREGCAEIRDMAVTVDHRRRGIGRSLIGRLEDAARASGSRRIGMAVDVGEEPARALYAVLGYRLAHGPHVISTALDTLEGPISVAGVMTYLTKEL